MRRAVRYLVWVGFAAIFAVLANVWWNQVDSSNIASMVPDVGDEVDAYLAQSEGRFEGLTSGAEKRVVWHGATGKMTPVSVVYLHGYSATSEEIRPVPDDVATALGANLFYTRLTGHGLPSDALGDVQVKEWFRDMAEAMEIGRRIGDRVLVLSTSTGGTLAALAAVYPEVGRDVAGITFVSPNFRLADPKAVVLTFPFSKQVLPLIFGETWSWEADSPEHEKYWTTSYPTRSVVPMAHMVKHVRGLNFSDTQIPGLFITSLEDSVVSANVTADIAARWGGDVRTELRVMGEGDDPNSHVIAGTIKSPGQTEETVAIILDWAAGVLN